jgi:hypothetical protein
VCRIHKLGQGLTVLLPENQCDFHLTISAFVALSPIAFPPALSVTGTSHTIAALALLAEHMT